MLDYKLIVTVKNLDDFYAQEECAVARLTINLKNFILTQISYIQKQTIISF